MSLNQKSPRNRIADSFCVEPLESRVLLSADPVLTPLAMAMLPHAMHVAAVPHGLTPAQTAQQLGGAAAHGMFNVEAMGPYGTMLHPAQGVTSTTLHSGSVSMSGHASMAGSFSAAQTASSASMTVQAVGMPASSSNATSSGRMHILSVPPGNGITWTTNQVGSNIQASGSLGISLAPTLTVTVSAPGSATLGASGDWVYGAAAGQNLSIVRSGTGSVSVNFQGSLQPYASSGQFALQNLSIGTASTPVSSVNFASVVNLTGNLTIYATGTVTFASTLTLTNNASLTIIGASNVTFNGAVNLNNLDGNNANGTSTVTGVPGNITIQADHITFPTGANAFSGSGALTILPATANHPIFFADPNIAADPNALVIANADLRYWGATFSSITIGSATAGHADSNAGPVSIGATQNGGTSTVPTVFDTVTFYGSTIAVMAPLPTGGAAYTFYASGNVGFDAVADITLANTVIANAGSGNITATSAAGAITESGAGTYLSAASLTATAVTGITLPSTQLANLTATNSGSSGSISVTQNATGGALVVLQALQSNAASTGNIAVTAAGGNLSVSSSGSGVITNGAGNIALTAQGSGSTLTVADNVTAHAGAVTLMAPGLLTLSAQTATSGGAVNVTSSAGGIAINANVLAAGGLLAMSALNDITMTAGTTLSSLNAGNSGAITLVAGGNDVLSTLAAGGTMAVTATAGAISSALAESTAASQLNLNGATAFATLTSARGIGARGADIQTLLSELTVANSVSGDVFVNQTQTGNLKLGTGSGNAVTLGGSTGTASIVTTDGAITVNGAVVSNASGGTAGQTGNLLIQASKLVSSSTDIVVGANVSSTTGSIEIKSAGSIAVGTASAITIAANAAGQTVYLQAAASVVFAAASQVNAGGNVWVSATGGHVTLGEIDSTGGTVAIDAGDTILDAQLNASQTVANITASSVRLSAVSGVGSSSNFVEVASGGAGDLTFAGLSSSGGIYLLSQTGLTVGSVGATLVQAIGPTATPTSVGDASALNSVAVYGAANLVLKSNSALTVASAIGLAGPVTISGNPISTQVRLDAVGQLNVNAAIGNIGGAFTTWTGNISLMGASGVTIAPAITVNTVAGTLDLESSAGSVAMGAGSLLASTLSSGGGAIRVLANQGITLGSVQTTNTVALTATNGGISDANGNVDGTLGVLNVKASGVRLSAATGIGSSTDELQVSAPALTAVVEAGSIYVLEAIATTVGSVGVGVQQVNLDGSTTLVTDAAHSGLATNGANGNIVLQANAGDLTLGSGVSANAGGNVLLQASAGSVFANAGVSSGSGNVTVLAASAVNIGSAGTTQSLLTGGAGTLDVEAGAGIVMSANSLLGAGSGAIRATGTSIQLARVSTAGNVSLTASAGSITDANGNSDSVGLGVINVLASGLRLNASSALGSSTDALQTQVATVSGMAGAGGLYLLNDQADSVGSVGATINQVGVSGATTTLSDAAQAGLVTSSNGNIVLQTTAGDLSINSAANANGSGNLLLQSNAGTLNVAANVDSSASSTGNGTGNISLWGATGVVVAPGAAVVTGSGTIDLESGAAVAMGAGSLLQSTSGSVGVQAATSVALATVQTNAGAAITAQGGSITDANGNANSVSSGVENVIATALRLQATGGIGQTSDALRTQASNVTASAGAAGVYLMSDQGESVSHATVVVNKVAQDGTAGTTLTQALQNGATATAGGNVVLQATAGDITLSSTSAALAAVTAAGGGNVLVQSVAGTVNVNASVYSNAGAAGNGSGNITVLGANGVNLGLVTGNPTVATGSGAIDIASVSGSILMAGNALVSDSSGAIRLAAAQNMGLGKVNTGGNVSLTAAGTISDANGNLSSNGSGTLNVQAAGLRVNAGGSAGTSTDALRTQAATLSANATSGGAYLINNQAIAVGSVAVSVATVGLDGTTTTVIDAAQAGLNAAATGNLVLDATTGDITLSSAIIATGTGNVLVQAQAGNVLANANVSAGSGAVSLLGAAGVTLASAQVSSTSGTLDLESSGGSVEMSLGSLVRASGDIRVKAAQSIGLAQVVTSGDVALTATAGNIVDNNGNANGSTGVADVQANGLRLFAGIGMGSTTDALQVAVNTLSENAGSGGAYVIGQQSVVVGSVATSVNQVGLAGTAVAVVDAAQAGLLSRDNGNLVLQASAGDVTLTSASPSVAAINANGSGNILVQSASGAVNANANVYSGNGSGSGNISMLGAAGVTVGSSGLVVTVGSGAGTVDVESAAGGVAMGAHSVLASGGADIRVLAAQNITVGEIEAGNNVALTAGGSIADANGNLNGQSGTVLNVASTGLRLSAGQGVGSGSDALQVQVASVAASVGTAGLFLVDGQSFAVTSVAATIEQVGLDGQVSAVNDATLTGVTAAADGDVVMQAASGDVTVGAAIATSGNANVLLRSVSGAVNVNANLTDSGHGAGSVGVLGASGVNLAANVAISAASSVMASLDVESANGSVQMAAGSTFSAGSVRVVAAQDIGLGQIQSPGNVALTATAGSVSNAAHAANNVTASALYLSAGTAAGTGANALQTQVTTLSAAVGNGGADVINDQGFHTGSVSTTVGQIGLDGTATGVTVTTVSDAIVSSGAVTLLASTGDIDLASSTTSVAAINASGSGTVTVQALAGSILVDANVLNGSGNTAGGISLLAAQAVTVGSNAAVKVVDGAGAMDIEAGNGNVAMAVASLLQASVGAVRVVAQDGVTLGQVKAAGNTWVQAKNGGLAVNNNVQVGTGSQAGSLTLLATGDIGLAAGITVSDGAGRVDVDSSGGNVQMAASSVLQSASGTINVQAALGVTLGQVQANGNTRVQAQGGAIAVDNALQVGSGAATGNLSLLASGAVNVAAGAVVSSGAGSLDVESGASVAMNATGVLQSVSGAVRVLAAGDIAVGQIHTAGNVALTATAGSITDASGAVDVQAAGLRLAAGNGVGQSGAPLEIQADVVTASAGASGIALLSDQSVTVGSLAVSVNQVSTTGGTSTVTDATQAGLLSGANGSISLQALSGDITLTPAGGNAITANGSGNVLVQALAATGNVNAYAGITGGSGNIDVEAGDNITLFTPGTSAAQISTALPGLVTVHAIHGTVYSGGTTQPGQTVNLNTDQLTLQAPLVGTNNQLNIGPATVASNPYPVVVGGTAAGGNAALYLSQAQIGLIQTGFTNVQIGSTMPGQAVNLVGQDTNGQPSANVFVNPLTLLASGAGGTVGITGGLQATSLNVEGSGSGTMLAAAAVSTSGTIVVNDNVIVTGASSLSSGTGGAADLTVNGSITGSGANNALSLTANGGNVVVTGAVSGLDALNVMQVTSLTFQSTLAVTGNLVINTTGVINFNGGVTIAAGGSLTINGATQVTFAAGADLTQAGNARIATNALNLNGGAGSIRGSSVLTLTAASASGAIHVGSTVVAGALNIGAQTVSAIAPGFQQVVLGTVDTATGHASSGAGSVEIQGNASLAAFAAPLAVYASTIMVDAGGTGVHVGGPLTLDAVGQIQIGSDVTTTVAANVVLTSATSTVQMGAQTHLGSQGGNVTVTTGNSSNATLAVIDTRATGSDVGAIVAVNVQSGRVIDANADSTVNIYAAAVSMAGYGTTHTAGSNQTSVLKVRAPVVYVAPPTGTVVADAGQDGRTNYNAFDHGTMYEELIAVGATTRVTLPGDAVLGGGPESLANQGVTTLDYSLIHAAASEVFISRLLAPTSVSPVVGGVSLSLGVATADDTSPSGYVLGSLSSHPSVLGVDSYGVQTYDYWTEALVV